MDWSDLKACMRRNCVPPSFKINQEQMCETIEFNRIGKTFIKKKVKFFYRENEFKEKLQKFLSEKKEREIQRRWDEKLRAIEEKEEELAEREEYKRKRREDKRREQEEIKKDEKIKR